jgi:hypothetical protein
MKFNMYPGQREYGEYDLKDYVTPDDTSAYLGYMVDRLRRLEIRAERRESEYLSMIIEEVASPDERNGLMVWYCVHLDTRDPNATHPRHLQSHTARYPRKRHSAAQCSSSGSDPAYTTRLKR